MQTTTKRTAVLTGLTQTIDGLKATSRAYAEMQPNSEAHMRINSMLLDLRAFQVQFIADHYVPR